MAHRVVDRSQHQNHGQPAEYTWFQASHRAELVGYITIFLQCKQMGMFGINPRRNLRIGTLAQPQLDEKEWNRKDQKWRQNQRQERNGYQMEEVTNPPAGRGRIRRRQSDVARLLLAVNEALQHVALLPWSHIIQLPSVFEEELREDLPQC